MLWQIQILNTKNEVKQQVDFEGSEASAKALATTLHQNYKKLHPTVVDAHEKPVRGMRHLPRWQHEWK